MLNRQTVFYTVLLWLRWTLSTSPGYIHPDEYFQSPEVAAGYIYNIKSFTPWEYQPEHAARSVLVPFLTTGLPLWILRYLGEQTEGIIQNVPRAIDMYFIERSASFMYSLLIGNGLLYIDQMAELFDTTYYSCNSSSPILDYAVYRMCRQIGKDPVLPILLVSTSQVMLVYYMRPFSNTIESILLSLSLFVYTTMLQKITSIRSFALGCLLSLGVFTRITFILYGFPVGIGYLLNAYKKSRRHLIGTILPFLLGGSIVAIACVFVDSLFYKSLQVTFAGRAVGSFIDLLNMFSDPKKWAQIRISGNVVLTPLNNILYNAKVENLKEHGLHPRYLHFLVNFPLLYGPLSTGTLVSLLWRPRLNASLYYVLVSVVAMAMIGLSIMPHQEARFLTPMLVPLVMIYTWNRAKFNRMFMFLWIAFNAITTVIFAGLHQGGLVPAMIFLQQQSLGIEGCHVLDSSLLGCNFGEVENSSTSNYDVTTYLLFYKTYMPPRHFLGYPNSWENNPDKPNINIHDFGGQFEPFYEALQERSGIPFTSHSPYMNFAPSKDKVEKEFERTLIVAPSMALLPKLENGRYLLLSSFTPHVNFDDIQLLIELILQGKFSRALISLNVYMVLTDENY
ncbi:hypothetical protein INT45_001296 [Circinella minor]|uniref:Mannosyltransferase n=1 Tax=Circinella minor TaxID=1195481 RepID=A0A8H7S8W5_9FUNG|nr:hypothetical protein INT45_001296 [Circinella minor]